MAGTKSAVVSFRIKPGLAKKFKSTCEHNDVTQAEILESLVQLYVEGKLEIKKTISLEFETK